MKTYITLALSLLLVSCAKEESGCQDCETVINKTSNVSTPGVPSTQVIRFTSCNPQSVIGSDTSHVWQGGVRITTISTTTCN